MEILVTGNIKWLEEEFFTVLAEQNKVIVCGKDAERIREKHISPYQFSIEQKEFEKLFFMIHKTPHLHEHYKPWYNTRVKRCT